MKLKFEKDTKWFGVLYVLTLVFAFAGKLGSLLLGKMDGITYHYISESHVPKIRKLLSIFTGTQLMAFAFGIAIFSVVFVVAIFLHGLFYAQTKKFSIVKSLLRGLVLTIVSLVSFVTLMLSSFSGLQIHALTKGSDGPSPLFGLILFLALIAISFTAASSAICACITPNQEKKVNAVCLIITSAVLSIAFWSISVWIFEAINKMHPVGSDILIRLGVGIVVNLVIIAASMMTLKKKNA